MAIRRKSSSRWLSSTMLGILAVSGWLALDAGRAADSTPEGESESPSGERPPSGNATVLGKDEIQGVLGKKIFSTTGESMGEIANVIVDRAGQPRAAVIDFGGFLGVGSRKIAVDWSALSFAPEGKPDRVTLDLTRDELKAAPEYREGKPVVVIGAAGKTEAVPANELP
jgi:hypothetical protein